LPTEGGRKIRSLTSKYADARDKLSREYERSIVR